MAAEISRFWDYDEVKGNEYQADEFAEYFRTFFFDGVPELDTNLQVYADDSGMQVKVGYGFATVQGGLYGLKDDSSGIKTLAIAASHTTYSRIDRIVLRRDKSSAVSSIIMTVLAGTPAASPVPTDLTREGNIYEISLARVLIGPGVLGITADMVTDERDDNDLCGLAENRVTRDRMDALVAALAGKANTNHSQAISTITGLIEALGLKADAAAMATALGLKADAAAMATALGLKADTEAMVTALAGKLATSAADGFAARGTATAIDDISQNGIYAVPSMGEVIHMQFDSNDAVQIRNAIGNAYLEMRRKRGGPWGNWELIGAPLYGTSATPPSGIYPAGTIYVQYEE